MRNRIIRFVAIYIQLVVVFIVSRAVFICVNSEMYSEISKSGIFAMFRHGLGMDLSTAGYFSVIPGLLTAFSVFAAGARQLKIIDRILYVYLMLASLVVSAGVTADAILYSYWGFKLDTTPLFYFLSSPSSAMASVTGVEMIFGFVLFIVLALAFYAGLWAWVRFFPVNVVKSGKAFKFLGLVLLTAVLFLPIRGGITVSTMNLSNAYFSPDQKLNHGAVNALFSFLYSATHQNDFSGQFSYFEPEVAESVLSRFLNSVSDAGRQEADTVAAVRLSTLRPDVYVVILESFSAHLVPCLGGDSVAVNLDSISRNGVLFSNMYASSFRTDRALPAILSGYPGQPTTSIMKFVDKTDNLPSFPHALKDNGYTLSYYYGGDVNFTNMKAYLVSAGFDKIISDKDFPVSERLSKWGVHDDKVFSRQLADMRSDTDAASPRLTVIQTSSSHEPFKVPYVSRHTDERKNAFAYADNSLGRWIDSLSVSPRWDSTLVVIVPDHYSVWPRNLKEPASRHHVPMVLTGGAVVSPPASIDAICSQTDIAATVLGLLGIDAADFPFSNNILSPGSPGMAFFSEPEFAAIVTANDTAVVSVATGEPLVGEPAAVDAVRAYLQILYSDLQSK